MSNLLGGGFNANKKKKQCSLINTKLNSALCLKVSSLLVSNELKIQTNQLISNRTTLKRRCRWLTNEFMRIRHVLRACLLHIKTWDYTEATELPLEATSNRFSIFLLDENRVMDRQYKRLWVR